MPLEEQNRNWCNYTNTSNHLDAKFDCAPANGTSMKSGHKQTKQKSQNTNNALAFNDAMWAYDWLNGTNSNSFNNNNKMSRVFIFHQQNNILCFLTMIFALFAYDKIDGACTKIRFKQRQIIWNKANILRQLVHVNIDA